MNIVTLNSTTMMSTKEVAELTDKRHGDVIRDANNMFATIDDANLRHEDFQVVKDYNLDAEAVRLLASRTRKKVNKAKLVTLAEALEWHTTTNNFHLVRQVKPPFDKKPNTKLTFGATV